ncbi:MAG: UDP-glucose 4-epimerase GalE [Alphaproteobacteria bacterium]|jgi:UDP-glucose-4-epimerase GalE|nr:UDP-glucose 4-epimerase GalE [Alphaproteobacteria bacterium]
MDRKTNIMKSILVTGGAGYIGSHVCYALKQQGYLPICFDNFSSGHRWAAKFGPIVEGDLLESQEIERTIEEYKPFSIIHLASFIQVGESVKNPAKYYENNIAGTINLLKAVQKYEIPYLVFSSSAAVYGTPEYTPIDENHPLKPINPYGHTKHITEIILQDWDKAYGLKSVSLRYFNAAGAFPEEGLGEAHEPETHLIPLMIRAAQHQKAIQIFGNDYDTADGTCVRDYIHVLDLANAHLKALDYLVTGGETVCLNLGTEIGVTNLQMVNLIEELFSTKVPYRFLSRREGDPSILLSSALKAKELLNWQPKYKISDILQHAWQWHSKEIYGE